MKRRNLIFVLAVISCIVCALCLCACGSSEDESGGGKAGVYTLGGIIVDANSTYEYFVDPSDMSYSEQNAYKQKISEYGENITVKDKGIDFDGLLLAQYNSAKYSISGKNIIFSNIILKAEFTYVTLEDGVLSLCYTKDLITPIVFEYYSSEYVAPSYKITFDYGENSDDSWITEKEVQFNTSVGELPSPEIEGHTFNGWGSGYSPITAETKFKWKQDITLTASWSANTYKVTYEYNDATGGNYYQDSDVRFNSMIYRLPTPIKTGYIFGGWFTEQDGNGQEITSSTNWMFAENKTLYAKWASNEYTLIFDYQGAPGETESQKIYYNTEIVTLPQPTKAGGNTFGGWFTEMGGAGEEYTADTVYLQTNNLTLYAKWNTSITFDYDGATSDNDITSLPVIYNGEIATMPRPHKQGSSFEGWFSDSVEYCAGEVFIAPGTTALKAKWIEGTDKDNFNYTSSNSGVIIMGLSEKGKNLNSIVIPAQFDGQEKLKITAYAFEASNISTAVVPESVTSIGYGAFLGCPLTEITIPFVGNSINAKEENDRVLGYIFGKYSDKKNENLINQADEIFYYGKPDCTFQIPQSLTKVTVTNVDGLKPLGFKNCKMINEININTNTTSIPYDAFYGCGIVDFVIPESVTTIARGAFSGCNSLNSISIPMPATYNANNHSYLNYLFGGTEYNSTNNVPSSLKTVNVTGDTTAISPYAFYGCSNLYFININKEITNIGQQAFKGCSNLLAITFNSSVPQFGNSCFDGISDDFMYRVSADKANEYQTALGVSEDKFIGLNKSFIVIDSGNNTTPVISIVDNGTKLIKFETPRYNNYIFDGWYSSSKLTDKFDFNSEITGDTVLYAKWTYNSIAIDTATTIDMSVYSGEIYYFTFIPETSGYFTIRSYGDLDTTGILYNASGSQITSNSNGGTGISPNFSIRYQLIARTTYIIGVRLTSATATGEYKIMIFNG